MIRSSCPGWKAALVLLAGIALPLVGASAHQVQLKPYITLGEYYTDNLFLTAPGKPHESAFVTEIKPGFDLAYLSPRLHGKIAYQLQGLIYPGHEDMNHAYNSLNANGTLEAVRNWFYVDASAIYDHQVVDAEKAGGRQNLFGGGNRTGIASATLSPYLRHDFGPVGIATLRYAYGRVYYTNDINNVASSTWSFSLVRQPQYGQLTYSLSYLDQRIEPEGNNDNNHKKNTAQDMTFQQARVGLQYHVTQHFALIANAGRENNFRANGATDELGSTFWNAGIGWNSREDHLKLLYGHRFFGKTYEFMWRHDAESFHTHVSYSEKPTNNNRMLLSRKPTTAIQSLLASYARLPSLRNLGVFVLKRATVGMAIDFSNSQLRLNLNAQRRNYIRLDEYEWVKGGSLSWEFAFSPRDSLTPSYSYTKNQYRDGHVDYYYRSQIEWKHQIGHTFDFHLGVRNIKRKSNIGRDYRVNTVVVELTKHF